jgi:hypothetical protein
MQLYYKKQLQKQDNSWMRNRWSWLTTNRTISPNFTRRQYGLTVVLRIFIFVIFFATQTHIA